MRSLAFYRDDPGSGPAAGTALPSAANRQVAAKRPRARWLLANLARAATTLAFSRQRQYITLKFLDQQTPPVTPSSDDGQTECLVVDSVAAFEVIAKDIGGSFRDSAADLRTRLLNGCVLSIARRRRHDGRLQVVGYEIAERGIFSALGRRMPVADDVIFSHYVEVLPACRGRRIHHLLFSTRDAYFKQRGGRVVCGVCEPQNHASLQALRRDGALIVGVVERIAVLRVFVMSYTPFDRIAHLLY